MFSQGRGHERLDSHDSFTSLFSDVPTHSLRANQGQSSPFLPSYLLGDNQSRSYSVSSPGLWNSGTSHGLAQTAARNTGLMLGNVPGQDTMRRDIAKGSVGGPPVNGLFSNPNLQETPHTGMPGSSRTRSSPALKRLIAPTRIAPTRTGLLRTNLGSQASNLGSQGSTSLEMLNQRQRVPVSTSQAGPFLTPGTSQKDPFHTQGDLYSSDVLDETWVTVFGFPPGASSFIIQQFSQYGTIIKHIILSECNWMHIHYMTKIQAKKALSKDGRIFGGCMKIGVVPCTEKSVMEERKRHLQDTMSTSTSDPGFGLHTPLRPLTAAYVASRSDYEVLRGKPVPRRDGSFISKLKEYVFGY